MYYVLGTTEEIQNPALLQEYTDRFLPILQRHQGTILALDEAVHAKEGHWPYVRTVLLAFPSARHAQDWYNSPEYQEIAILRNMAAVMNLVFIRGLGEPVIASAA